jgi:flavin reductase (DIM6/NTAB) family NADH-FMN oxidoreductase RutF
MSVRRLAPTTDPRQLRRAFGCFPSGVTALCALVDGTPAGMVVSSFTSVSLDPPLVSVCVDHGSTTWPRLRSAPRLGISVLASAHDAACCQLASTTADRFAGLAVQHTELGAVFLDGSPAWLDCTLHAKVPAGDHDIALLRVEALHAEPDTAPLVFHGSRFHRLVTR